MEMMNLFHNLSFAVYGFIIVVFTLLIVYGPNEKQNSISYLPEFSPTYRLSGNERFIGWDNATNELWEIHIPANGGFVLSTDYVTGEPFWSSVSMIHQIHCLMRIRMTMLRLITSQSHADHFNHDQSHFSYNSHIGHCFDYVRQGIICAADSTIEQAHPSPMAENLRQWRRCRETQFVYDWAMSSGTAPTPEEVHNEAPGRALM